MTHSSSLQISTERFPVGQRVTLLGHFLEPVTLEGIRFIGSGYECRVRLADGTPDEAILSLDEAAALVGQLAIVWHERGQMSMLLTTSGRDVL